MKNFDKKDSKNIILLSAFTYRKIIILNALSYFIKDTITQIPVLSTKKKINDIDFKNYLEKKTNLIDRSLSTFYYNTLIELENSKIIKNISKNGKKFRSFTEIGLQVILFFTSLLNFFGEENFLDILNILRNPGRKRNFLDVLAKIIDLNRIQANKEPSIYSLFDKHIASKLDLNLEKIKPPQLYLKPKNLQRYIIEVTKLPASTDRREKLLLSIERSFQTILGNDLKQKTIQEFKQLREVFESWNLLPVSDYKPKTGFDQRITSIINEQSKPLYALNIGNSLKFCSEFHFNEKVGLDLVNILIFIELLNDYLTLSLKNLKIIEISFPSLGKKSFPKIYFIPIKNKTFLVTAYKPLYWSNFESNLEFIFTWPESPNIDDSVYFIIKKSYNEKNLEKSDDLLAISSNLINHIIILIDDLFFNKANYRNFINIQNLRESWSFDADLWNSFESTFKDAPNNRKSIEFEQNPIFNSEHFCYIPIPKIKIYYNQHLIKSGATTKEGAIYFSLYSTNNTASPEYNEIIKLLKIF